MFSFCLFIFHFCFAATATSKAVAHAYFFDVGQGHCFFFVTTDKRVAVLIDAGSAKCPKYNVLMDNEINANSRAEAIANEIKEHIDGSTKMLVIATHGDIDHYSWLGKIVNGLSAKLLLLIGGVSSDYQDDLLPSEECCDLQEVICASAKEYSSFRVKLKPGEIPQPNLNKLNERINGFINLASLKIEILSASSNMVNKNDRSIVVRLAYKEVEKSKEFSFIIPGDATGKVTDAILKSAKSVQSTVLLASHHGATTDGSNNESWLNAIKPEYVVFSCGDKLDYCHPHPKAVQLALNEVSLYGASMSVHDFFCGQRVEDCQILSVNPLYDTFVEFKSSYRLMLTSCNIFSTYNQGDIKFILKNNGKIEVRWSKKPITENQPSMSAEEDILYNYLRSILISKYIVFLRIVNRPDLVNVLLPRINNSLLSYAQFLSSLRSMDLSGSPLGNDDSQDALVSFLRHHKIKELKITDSGDLSFLDNLKRAWNNRGLEFVH